MDEFDIFRARAYGGYVESSAREEDTVRIGLNGNVENEWTRRESVERVGGRRRSSRKSGDSGEPSRYVDRSQSPGGLSGERRGSARSRINSQVTVAVEPPSPTDLSREAHQRSQSWKTRHARLRPDCSDQEEYEQKETTVASPRYATPSPSGLHRTRTMPARRSVSPKQRSPAPNHPVIVEPSDDSPTSPDGSQGECKIYRVRSFTTKKGGIVNRGDSIKICNARRASRCDNLLVAFGDGLSRRNSTTSSGRGSLQPFQPSPSQLRRSSDSCIDAAANDDVSGAPSSSPSARASSERRPSQSSTRASCRNVAYDDHDEGVVELIPGRRASVMRLQSSGGETGVCNISSNALWSAEGKMPINGVSCPQGDGDVRMKVNGRPGDYACEEEEEEEDGEGEGAGGEEQVYNVMVVGSHGVGKTTLIHQLLTSEYLANKENYQADHDVGEKIVSVQLDDVESMVHFIDAAFSEDPIKECDEDVDAYLVVYSVTDRSSFAYCQSCLQEIQKGRKRTVAMLVANKQDLVRNRVISEGEGKRLASKKKCEFLEVSGLLDHRVDEVLVTIIRLIRQRYGKSQNGGGVAGGSRGDKGHVTSSDDDLHSNRGCIHKAAAAIFRKLFK